jgi:Tfp pilus assembly protein PilX
MGKVLFARLGRLLRSERGVALPVAVSMLMASGALAGVAATSAITSDRQASRDRNVKRAVAAADAGIDVGVYRLNKFALSLNATNQCVTMNGSGVLAVEPVNADGTAAGWCRAQTESLGEGASFTYRVSQRQQVNVGGQDVWQRKVVAVGLVNGVQRRAATQVSAPTGNPLFAYTIFSHEDLVMRNNSSIEGTARTNGNAVIQNSSKICGDLTVGTGKQLRGSKNCSSGSTSTATEPLVLAPVKMPATNENWRLTIGSPGPDDPRSGSVSWNTSTRVLSLDNDGQITLNGGIYILCGLTLNQNGRIIIPDDGTPVKIYIDAPERCAGANPRGSVSLEQSSRIVNASGDPTMVQLYVVGSTSPSLSTQVAFRNGHDLSMVVYAPNSLVTFDNQNTFRGAVMAKKVEIRNKAEIIGDPRVANLMGDDVPLQVYKRQSWIECNAQGGTTDSGC